MIDYAGALVAESGAHEPFAGGEGRDQLVELGSGNLIEGFERELIGASAGESRTLALTFPADYEREDLASPRRFLRGDASRRSSVKQLPEVDDDLAIDTGFDTLEDLREDIRGRLLEGEQRRVEEEFRAAALDAAVEQAQVQVPGRADRGPRAGRCGSGSCTRSPTAGSRARPTCSSPVARSRRSSPRTPPPPSARCAARRVLTAVVEAEGIEPGEEELLEALRPAAEREQLPPEELLRRLRDAGRLEEIREDLAARGAIELIASHRRADPARAGAGARAAVDPRERAHRARPRGAGGGGVTEHTREQGQEVGGLWTPDR